MSSVYGALHIYLHFRKKVDVFATYTRWISVKRWIIAGFTAGGTSREWSNLPNIQMIKFSVVLGVHLTEQLFSYTKCKSLKMSFYISSFAVKIAVYPPIHNPFSVELSVKTDHWHTYRITGYISGQSPFLLWTVQGYTDSPKTLKFICKTRASAYSLSAPLKDSAL